MQRNYYHTRVMYSYTGKEKGECIQMRKQTKLAVGVSAAALLAIGASMTSFAETRGWVNEGDAWYYYDNSGDYVTDRWKSYNGNYFYLGDEGYMLTNQLVEDGDNYYYVDANGAMVKNTWVAIAADEDEEEDVDYRWYYFGSSGKAYKDSTGKTINGKKYGFDEEGKMLFGFVDANGSSINTEDDAILSCTYYFGTNDDGARHSGWLRYEDGFDSTDYDDLDYEYFWFWFASNGQKRTTPKKINGHNYYFDDQGVMITEWADGAATASESRYFNDNLENGSLEKNAWVWTSAPESWGIDDEDDHWFRTDNKGYILTDQTKKINSKWYVFDDNGIMQYGLVVLNQPKVSGSEMVGDAIDEDNTDAEQIYAIDNGYLFYFSDNEESDGAMKTGSSIKISLADDDYTFGFTKTTGEAFCGVENNKVYRNGIRQEASDDKYAIVYGGYGDEVVPYLVNSTGTRMKVNKYYKDDNDEYFVVYDGTDKEGYAIVQGIEDIDTAKALLDKADTEKWTIDDLDEAQAWADAHDPMPEEED